MHVLLVSEKQAVPCLYDPKHRGSLGTKREDELKKFKTVGFCCCAKIKKLKQLTADKGVI
jgi:hypothetical protein